MSNVFRVNHLWACFECCIGLKGSERAKRRTSYTVLNQFSGDLTWIVLVASVSTKLLKYTPQIRPNAIETSGKMESTK